MKSRDFYHKKFSITRGLSNAHFYKEVIQKVEAWLREDHTLHVSAMAWAEFQCGPLLPEENAAAVELLNSVLPITAELAAEAGRLFDETGRRSRSLADCLIAATAISQQASLATHNTEDFQLFAPYGLGRTCVSLRIHRRLRRYTAARPMQDYAGFTSRNYEICMKWPCRGGFDSGLVRRRGS